MAKTRTLKKVAGITTGNLKERQFSFIAIELNHKVAIFLQSTAAK